MVSKTDSSSFRLFEEGELSETSSIENDSSVALHSTAFSVNQLSAENYIEHSVSHSSNQSEDLIDNFSSIVHDNFLSGLSSCTSSDQSTNGSIAHCSKRILNDRSLIESERSLIEIFSMDVSQDAFSDPIARQKKEKFTGWTQQLIEERENIKQREELSEQVIRQKLMKEESLKKREQNKLVSFSNDIARCLREKRSDIVYKIVQACGFIKSSELCAEAQRIYSTTGMQTQEGRKRTLGGCFFQLVKMNGNLNDSQKKEIFYEPTAMMPLRKKQRKQEKKKLKKQLKNQTSKLDQIKDEFARMNIDITVRLK